MKYLTIESLRDLLGFIPETGCETYNLSPHTVDFSSFDNISIETDIAQEMIFRGKRTGIIRIYTKNVSPGVNLVEEFRQRVQW